VQAASDERRCRCDDDARPHDRADSVKCLPCFWLALRAVLGIRPPRVRA